MFFYEEGRVVLVIREYCQTSPLNLLKPFNKSAVFKVENINAISAKPFNAAINEQ